MMANTNNQAPLQRSRSMTITAEDLSYHTMTVEPTGKVMSNDQKEKLRKARGFCATCQGTPILCFSVVKSRLNPLRVSKDALTVNGDCFEGICLKCHPEKDPRRQRFAMTKGSGTGSSGGFQSRRDIQRDLSNGSLALSQSRRDLFRASQGRIGREQPVVKREGSNSSMGTLATLGSIGSFGSNNSARHMSVSSTLTPSTTASSLASSSCHSHGRAHTTLIPALEPLTRGTSLQDGIHLRTNLSLATHNNTFQTPQFGPTTDSATTTEPEPQSQASLSSTTEQPSTLVDDLDDSSTAGLSLTISSHQTSTCSITEPTLQASRSTGSQNAPPRSTRRVANLTSLRSTPRGSITSQNNPLLETAIKEETTLSVESEALKLLSESINSASNGQEADFDFVVDFLVNEIFQVYSTEESKLVCLEGIVKLCENANGNIERFSETNVTEEIVFAMKNFNNSAEVQQKATAAMVALATVERSREALIQSGACRLLVRTLKAFMEEQRVVEGSVKAMGRLLRSTAARDSFKSLMASKYVCEAMQKHRSLVTLQLDACAFLCNVSVDETQSKVSIVNRELLEAIVVALHTHKSHDKLVKFASLALHSLTFESKNVRALRGVEGVFDLFDNDGDESNLLFRHPEAFDILVRLQVCEVEDESLEDAALEDLQMKVALKAGKPEAIEDIVALMKEYDWSNRVARECFHTLALMGGESREHVAAIHDVGLEELLDWMKRFLCDGAVMEAICNLFKVLARGIECERRALHEVGASAVLIESLQKNATNLELSEMAFPVLEMILSGAQSWDTEEGLDVIVALMEAHEDSAIIRRCGKAILGRFGREL